MGDMLSFVNSNQGGLLLVLVIVNAIVAVELRNVKSWVSDLNDEMKDIRKAKK